VVERDGEPVVVISGVGYDRRGLPPLIAPQESSNLPRIVVACAGDEEPAFELPATYFALGGRHARHTASIDAGLVHYPGTPQGRAPQHDGAHGCTIVEIDDAAKVRTRLVPTDRARWFTQNVIVDSASEAELRETLTQRLASLASANPGVVCLAHWRIAAPPKLARQLASGTLAAELTDALRGKYAVESAPVWTTTVDVAETPLADELYEQESLLGELLRSIQLYQQNPEQPLELEGLLADRYASGSLASAVALDNPDGRGRALDQAARLAVDLLTAEEPRA
jgi:hypothetical protein